MMKDEPLDVQVADLRETIKSLREELDDETNSRQNSAGCLVDVIGRLQARIDCLFDSLLSLRADVNAIKKESCGDA